ncbi:hypothetical protein Micbo1qcDRAFT_175204 [Microdochium bolleyi]|uniref:Uncharacterized protein n=1 Tax=Microdochium bolleyi TaxID=196109 RepID=A0A136J4T9_9PEZI|nr:hypothetical protein Micbo1qcDRAFT_175204 [Microdochium bolleyi]
MQKRARLPTPCRDALDAQSVAAEPAKPATYTSDDSPTAMPERRCCISSASHECDSASGKHGQNPSDVVQRAGSEPPWAIPEWKQVMQLLYRHVHGSVSIAGYSLLGFPWRKVAKAQGSPRIQYGLNCALGSKAEIAKQGRKRYAELESAAKSTLWCQFTEAPTLNY